MNNPAQALFPKTLPYNADIMAGRRPVYEAPPFGQRLATLRKERGLSQEQFGKLVGKTRRAIDYYERRAKNPTAEFIEKAASALGVGVADLMGEATDGKARKRPGPKSSLELQFERVQQLPKKQQHKIMEVVDALLAQQQETG